jgi:hypothetical protein
MDFDKTFEIYQRHELAKTWENVPDNNRYKKEKGWYEKVKSKRTGDYYQAEDLIKRDLVPPEWTPPHVDAKGKPIKYPIKHVNEIFRKRIADGSEWLLSHQIWTSLDEAGNPISISMNQKEMFDDILPIYKLKPENPKDRDTKMKREFDHIEHRPRYTLPFTAENVQKLYDMRNGNCPLIIMDESRGDKPPISVDSFEHFKTRLFDELWNMVAIPRYKMDRPYGEGLDDTGVQ